MRAISLLGLLVLTSGLLGHGVSHILLRDAYGIQVSYEDGNPLAFADVEIFRPLETEMEFQTGMTDENGRFMFKPDTSGSWTMKVSDGLGHGKVIEVIVDEVNTTASCEGSLSRLQKIISGLGYILFIFSGWYLITRWRQEKHAHS
ncbi:hypothetical protein HQ531_08380 [bacterium]|nr:hypothetical protein [bacterium]